MKKEMHETGLEYKEKREGRFKRLGEKGERMRMMLSN